MKATSYVKKMNISQQHVLKLFPVKGAYCGRREVTTGSFHTIAIANIHFTTFHENSSYCVSRLISEVHRWWNNQNKLNLNNMQTILSQMSQLSRALNTVKPAVLVCEFKNIIAI